MSNSNVPSREYIRKLYQRALEGERYAIITLMVEAVLGLEPRKSLERRKKASKQPSRRGAFLQCAKKLIMDGEVRYGDREFASVVAMEMSLAGDTITPAGVRKYLKVWWVENTMQRYQKHADEKNL